MDGVDAPPPVLGAAARRAFDRAVSRQWPRQDGDGPVSGRSVIVDA
jgi:hypothetical protein